MQDEHRLHSSTLLPFSVLFTWRGCYITFWSTLLHFMKVCDQTQTRRLQILLQNPPLITNLTVSKIIVIQERNPTKGLIAGFASTSSTSVTFLHMLKLRWWRPRLQAPGMSSGFHKFPFKNKNQTPDAPQTLVRQTRDRHDNAEEVLKKTSTRGWWSLLWRPST